MKRLTLVQEFGEVSSQNGEIGVIVHDIFWNIANYPAKMAGLQDHLINVNYLSDSTGRKSEILRSKESRTIRNTGIALVYERC